MLRFVLTIAFITSFWYHSEAQRYKSFEGTISIFSEAPGENVDAVSKDVSSVLDVNTLEIVFSVPIQSFEFDKSLMKRHFNEKYMESDDYPNSMFMGKVIGFDPAKPEKQQVNARGEMIIHGVSKRIDVVGTLELRDGKIRLESQFLIKIEDYKVRVPQLFWINIAEEVLVTLDIKYKTL
jgi:hypothetical protein